ncbi:hypothetical protein BGZ54_000790 [Gamsiella multidivaricata]|nr:hypothetical protein BGZ54_000790 [Gamsiella multidivaricata]
MSSSLASTRRPCDDSAADSGNDRRSLSTPNQNGHDTDSNENTRDQPDQPERPPRQREPRPISVQEGGSDERPELDDFVKGFYDGDKFTDVDSRVWV